MKTAGSRQPHPRLGRRAGCEASCLLALNWPALTYTNAFTAI